MGNNLIIEAKKLGLHTVPSNLSILNIIKRCRVCTDLQWIPAIDYDRPMPLTGLRSKFIFNESDQEIFKDTIIINGKFKAGVSYKGIPWTAHRPDDSTSAIYNGFQTYLKPTQFQSIISLDNAPTYIDSLNQKTYPYYGWNEPVDFIRFVFGGPQCINYLQDYQFYSPFFIGSLNETQIPGYNPASRLLEDSMNYMLENFTQGSIITQFSNLSLAYTQSIGIITDMFMDSDGILYIELSEATRYGLKNTLDINGQYGNLIRRKWYTAEELLEWFQWPINRVS